jgi:hypothetical protein
VGVVVLVGGVRVFVLRGFAGWFCGLVVVCGGLCVGVSGAGAVVPGAGLSVSVDAVPSVFSAAENADCVVALQEEF